MIYGILTILGGITALFSGYFFRDVYRNREALEKETSFKLNLGLGLFTDFFDTLGIGNFAPTTALFRAFRQVKDRILPGTLNVSHTIPVVLEALLFLIVIEVELITLVSMIAASVVGAVLGVGIVAKLPERTIQYVMGISLLVTAFLMIAGQLEWISELGTGTAIELRGLKLVIGVVANFVLGALMTVGIGLYAPCMALVYLLGMAPVVAFPIMMGSCAFLMPPASARFIQKGAYNRKASLAITLGGVIGVLIAVYVVKALPLTFLKWLVTGVILYTSVTLIYAAATSTKSRQSN
jgi:uncharacterized membrane protein YfcA